MRGEISKSDLWEKLDSVAVKSPLGRGGRRLKKGGPKLENQQSTGVGANHSPHLVVLEPGGSAAG